MEIHSIRILHLTSVALAILTVCCPENTIGQSQTVKPNILFILADDLGYSDIHVYNPESKIPTPNIDKMAQSGMMFTSAHAPAAVCTPTRYSLLTGRYSWRSERKKGVAWVWEKPIIHEGRLTIGEMLQKQGYHTACVGKWHLGMDWQTTDNQPPTLNNQGKNIDYNQPVKNGPVDRGFDYYFGQEVPGFPPHCFIENNHVVEYPGKWLGDDDYYGSREGMLPGIPGAKAPGWRYEDLMHRLTEKARLYILDRSVNNPDVPFFLYYSMSAPHTPIAPHESFQGKTDVGRYGDYVFEMDYHVGSILKLVDSLGISENTLVIFSSDNGGVNEDGLMYTSEIGALIKNYGHNSNDPLKGMKSDAWEGGHRVPFIAQWPGQINSGSASGALISLVDMMATFAEIAEVNLGDSVAEDSYNQLPVFTGKEKQVRQAVVSQSGEGILAIRDEDWKLILSSGGGGKWSGAGELPVRNENGNWENVQLYNLPHDLQENSDLAGENPEKVEELMLLLKQYVMNGRSTPGPVVQAEGTLWDEVKWMNELP